MENEQQQTQTAPSCRAGCGFFGASATEGYCSQCFKNTLKRQQDTVRLTSPVDYGLVGQFSADLQQFEYQGPHG
uniref:A20-type domain-containing protein n=1 Tax=Caenorhabditis japonica TaxID=281687 RepID=A0A8R1I5C6_CAEJA